MWHGLETHLMQRILQLPFPAVELLDRAFKLGLVRSTDASGIMDAFHVQVPIRRGRRGVSRPLV